MCCIVFAVEVQIPAVCRIAEVQVQGTDVRGCRLWIKSPKTAVARAAGKALQTDTGPQEPRGGPGLSLISVQSHTDFARPCHTQGTGADRERVTHEVHLILVPWLPAGLRGASSSCFSAAEQVMFPRQGGLVLWALPSLSVGILMGNT